MEIRLAKSNKDFINTYGDLLKKYPVELQLFNLNLTDETKETDKNSSRGGIYAKNKLALLFLDANPFNLQLYGIDNSEDVTDVLVNYLLTNDISIKGILGNSKDTDLFIKCYTRQSKVTFRKHLAMDIMKLEHLRPVNVNGTIVHPSLGDVEFLLKGIKTFSREALHEDMKEELALSKVQNFLTEEYNYLFRNEEGIPVSFVQARLTKDGGSRISMVYTAPEYRNRGYGKAMMYLVSQKLLTVSKYCTLFVDKENPVSNKVYKDIGYYILRDNIEYMIDR